MNRSDAFWCAISLRNEVKSMLLIFGSCGAGDWGLGIGDSEKRACAIVIPVPAPVPAFTNPEYRISNPGYSKRRVSFAYSFACARVTRPRLTRSCSDRTSVVEEKSVSVLLVLGC